MTANHHPKHDFCLISNEASFIIYIETDDSRENTSH